LQDGDERVVEPALDNAQLTESFVVQALMKPRAPEVLFELASEHRNWSLRPEVQLALLRSEKTPLSRAQEFASSFSNEVLESVLPDSRKAFLRADPPQI